MRGTQQTSVPLYHSSISYPDELFLHGNLTSGNNRFFDKLIQIFVTNNGKAGLMGEYSMMDGMPMVGLADHVTATTYAAATERRCPQGTVKVTGCKVKNIFDEVNLSLQTSNLSVMIAQAKHNYTKNMARVVGTLPETATKAANMAIHEDL